MADTATTDELGERIIAAGFAPNDFILDLNTSLSVPDGFPLPSPWNLPSRLFRFPIEVSRPVKGYPRRIGLMHPALGGHPFVQHVGETLGIELERDGAPNDHGVSHGRIGRWWHAVDLVTAGQWRALLATAEFTTPADIMGAVAHGLRYSRSDEDRRRKGCLSPRDARAILSQLGATEPTNRTATLCAMMKPSPCKSDGSAEHWPINTGAAIDAPAKAWAFVFGIEDGWFEYDRGGHLQWSPKGRDRHAAGDSRTFAEAGGQLAMAF